MASSADLSTGQPVPAPADGGSGALRAHARARSRRRSPSSAPARRSSRSRSPTPHRRVQRDRARDRRRPGPGRGRHPPRRQSRSASTRRPSGSRSTFDTALTPGTWVLHTAFTGMLNDKLHGFYRSTFTDDDGVDAGHRHHPVRGHRRPPGLPVLGRARLQGRVRRHPRRSPTELDRRLQRGRGQPRARATTASTSSRFADTMTMSTYLVAFVVGPLEVTEPGRRRRHARCASSTRPARATSPATRSRSARSALRFFADYYGIPYPGDKLDLVAVPDFAFGAMENLGCVTFRETLRARRPRRRPPSPSSQRVADVIAHELRPHVVRRPRHHEVVERHLAQRGLRHLHGDARHRRVPARVGPLDRLRPARARPRSTSTRSTRTRPIEFEVVSPDDAEGMFDVLTYEKGAAVVRMLEQYLGADPFRDGIRHYLTSHAYGNTETTDLWDAIEAATGEPVRAHHGHLDLPGRLPADHRRPGQRRQRAAAQPGARSATPATWARATRRPARSSTTSAGRCRSIFSRVGRRRRHASRRC